MMLLVRRNESGSAALEMVIMAPVMIMFLLFIVGLGRMSQARQEVNSAAYEAARAASLQRNTGASAADGREAALRTLGDRGMSCTSLNVGVDVSSYRPDGRVTATVTCVASLGDLALSGLPGSKTFRATAVVPIEQYRSGP